MTLVRLMLEISICFHLKQTKQISPSKTLSFNHIQLRNSHKQGRRIKQPL